MPIKGRGILIRDYYVFCAVFCRYASLDPDTLEVEKEWQQKRTALREFFSGCEAKGNLLFVTKMLLYHLLNLFFSHLNQTAQQCYFEKLLPQGIFTSAVCSMYSKVF